MGELIEFPSRATSAEERETEEFMERLRTALADELLAKLPGLVPLATVPRLLRVPDQDVFDAVCDGEIVTERVGGVTHMVTAQSIGFIRREWRSRLVIPQPARAAGVARGRFSE